MNRHVLIGCAFVLLCLCGIGTQSWASRPGRPDPEVQEWIRQGKANFQTGKFAEALALYRKAYDQTQLHGLLFMQGRCLEELGQFQAALDLFDIFVQGPAEPEARGMAQAEIRLLREKLAVGTLIIQVSPFGALVQLGNQTLGPAPVAPQQVKPGRYDVYVKLEGYLDYRENVEVHGGKEARVMVALIPKVTPPVTGPGPGPGVTPPVGPGVTSPVGPTTHPVQGGGPKPTTGPNRAGAQTTQVNGSQGPVVIAGPLKPRSYSPWTWVTLGSGAALVLCGIISYGVGEAHHRKVANAISSNPTEPSADLTMPEAIDLEHKGDVEKRLGYALWGLGGGVLVSSAVLFILEKTSKPAAAGPMPKVSVEPTSGGAFLTATGRF